jgi:adenylate cyclase
VSAVLPDEIRSVIDNGIPVILATCSADGVPNVSIVSEVTWVDAGHVALSFQFFSKTIRNVRENPRARLLLNDHAGGRRWILDVHYVRSETEGPLFDAMEMQIEAVASLTGMSGIFRLRSADVYRVLGVDIVTAAS